MTLNDKPMAVADDVLRREPKLLKRINIRFIVVGLLALGTFVGYASRSVLSVAIVAMVNGTNPDFPSFDWHELGVEGYIHSSFFWGYSLGQIPVGLLIQQFGNKWPLFGAIFFSSLCLILIPPAAIYGGWQATVAVRALQGLTQAALFPGLQSSLAIWTPLEERGRLATVVLTGSQFGTIVAFPACGFLVPSSGGWPSVFYLFGGVGILWCMIWLYLGASSPGEHRFITKEELELINKSTRNKYAIKLKTPWKEIFTSKPMWALICTHATENFGFWLLMSEIPTYFAYVLDFDMKQNGLLSSLPYLVMAGLSFVFGWIADFAFKKKWLTVEASRKVFNTIGFWIPAAALIGLGFIKKSEKFLGVGLMVVAIGFNAGNYLGFSLGHMDLSPNFSGILMAITNCGANIFSTIGTLLADAIVKGDKTSTANWQIVFGITAAMFFFGNLIYIVFGKVERQPWNEIDYKRESSTDEKDNNHVYDVSTDKTKGF